MSNYVLAIPTAYLKRTGLSSICTSSPLLCLYSAYHKSSGDGRDSVKTTQKGRNEASHQQYRHNDLSINNNNNNKSLNNHNSPSYSSSSVYSTNPGPSKYTSDTYSSPKYTSDTYSSPKYSSDTYSSPKYSSKSYSSSKHSSKKRISPKSKAKSPIKKLNPKRVSNFESFKFLRNKVLDENNPTEENEDDLNVLNELDPIKDSKNHGSVKPILQFMSETKMKQKTNPESAATTLVPKTSEIPAINVLNDDALKKGNK